MKTKILGSLVVALAMLLAAGTASAAGADFLQPASIVTFDEAVDVNSSLKTTLPSYFLAGMHVGQQVVGGVSFLQGTIINTTTKDGGGSNPVTIGDDLRVDGWLQRGTGGLNDNMPVKVNDNMWLAGNIQLQSGMTVDGIDVSELNISEWDQAYSWGDHSIVGYLTGYTEIDPIYVASPSSSITSAGSGLVVTAAERTNWNEAFTWGNHAAVGYLEPSDIGVSVQAHDNDLDALALINGGSQGDILYYDSGWNRLAKGSDGEFLKSTATVPEWDSTPSDGWHGSTTRIKLLPSDFRQTNGTFHNYLDGFGSGTDGGAVRMPDNTDGAAMVAIPTGYRATA